MESKTPIWISCCRGLFPCVQQVAEGPWGGQSVPTGTKTVSLPPNSIAFLSYAQSSFISLFTDKVISLDLELSVAQSTEKKLVLLGTGHTVTSTPCRLTFAFTTASALITCVLVVGKLRHRACEWQSWFSSSPPQHLEHCPACDRCLGNAWEINKQIRKKQGMSKSSGTFQILRQSWRLSRKIQRKAKLPACGSLSCST